MPEIPPQTLISQSNNIQHWNLLNLRLLWANQSEKSERDNWKRASAGPPTGAWLVLHGHCKVTQDGETVHADEGQWIFPRPGVRDQFFVPGTRVLSVGFLARWPQGVDLINNPRCQILAGKGCDELTQKAYDLVESMENLMGDSCEWQRARHWGDSLPVELHFEIGGLFQLWLACFIRVAEQHGARIERMTSKDSRVEAAIHAMEMSKNAQLIDWNSIQKSTGLSRRRIDELFRQETGLSLSAYFGNLQLKRISRELLDRRLQIKEIALAAGFNHTSSFSRWFRQHIGMTPSEYRNSDGETDPDAV
ncbi:helix-turn-helix transcriptional regulator [Rubellicoccus peritrichatus]|uniref:Helix-turn-helix transcriptional regulator n=1 Tax=Rubellicoccus peritrichatus TaxID=3080537 RepID=A0AAQ3LDV2_9BACT|nr:helix-turn-helix transcriptional regulator [Puniceicoccus sp. CR14]WOO42772.1 helix-turn-helix transcriptional regulator [Puniceicoccus sp. CR14]